MVQQMRALSVFCPEFCSSEEVSAWPLKRADCALHTCARNCSVTVRPLRTTTHPFVSLLPQISGSYCSSPSLTTPCPLRATGTQRMHPMKEIWRQRASECRVMSSLLAGWWADEVDNYLRTRGVLCNAKGVMERAHLVVAGQLLLPGDPGEPGEPPEEAGEPPEETPPPAGPPTRDPPLTAGPAPPEPGPGWKVAPAQSPRREKKALSQLCSWRIVFECP